MTICLCVSNDDDDRRQQPMTDGVCIHELKQFGTASSLHELVKRHHIQ